MLRKIREDATASYWRLMHGSLVRHATWITREDAAEGLEPWLQSLGNPASTLNQVSPPLPFHASRYLDQISRGAKIFAFGAGGVLALLASRAGQLVVVEDSAQFADKARALVKARIGDRDGVVLHIGTGQCTPAQAALTRDDPQSYRSQDDDDPSRCYKEYATAIEQYPDNTFDVVVLSGRARPSCFMHAVAKLRIGGYIVVDDVGDQTNRRVCDMAEELGFLVRRYYGMRPGTYTISETLFLRKHRKSYSLYGLDKMLEQYVDFDNGFFIEAGGNNGVRQSNSLYFEAQRGWRGMLIEAVPALAHECRQYRPHAIVEQVALAPPNQVPGKVTIHYAGLMSVVASGMATQAESMEHVRLGCEIQNIQTYDVEVDTATLSGLLDKHGVGKVDLLSLDVEGFELQALSGLDFERHAPTYILVEIRYAGIREFLERHHYDQIAQLTHHDFLFRLSAGHHATH